MSVLVGSASANVPFGSFGTSSLVMRLKSSQVQVSSSGRATPAFSNTDSLTIREMALTPVGTPYWTPPNLPLSSAAAPILSVFRSALARSSRAPRSPYSRG